MRKLFVLFTFLCLVGCDPYFDSYVNPADRKTCSRLANGQKSIYIKCLKDMGYKDGTDPLWSGKIVLLKD